MRVGLWLSSERPVDESPLNVECVQTPTVGMKVTASVCLNGTLFTTEPELCLVNNKMINSVNCWKLENFRLWRTVTRYKSVQLHHVISVSH